MNIKRLGLAFVGVYIFIFAFDFILHSKCLMGIYQETSHIWRPPGEGNMLFLALGQLLYSIMICYIFTLNYQGKGVGEGVRYGFLIGLLTASLQIGTYTYLPIPLTLTLAWVGGEILRGLGAGIILSLLYKKA